MNITLQNHPESNPLDGEVFARNSSRFLTPLLTSLALTGAAIGSEVTRTSSPIPDLALGSLISSVPDDTTFEFTTQPQSPALDTSLWPSTTNVVADSVPAALPSTQQQTNPAHTPQTWLGWAAGLLTLAGSAFYIRQIAKNGSSSKTAWGIIAVNDALAAATAAVLGTRENWWLTGAMAVGSVAGFVAACKFCNSMKVTTTEKICLGASVIGWAAMMANAQDPVVSALIAQGVNALACAAFCIYQFKHPREITRAGQFCYLAGAVCNLFAMTELSLRSSISPLGSFFGTSLCFAGLIAGLTRASWKAKGDSSPLP